MWQSPGFQFIFRTLLQGDLRGSRYSYMSTSTCWVGPVHANSLNRCCVLHRPAHTVHGDPVATPVDSSSLLQPLFLRDHTFFPKLLAHSTSFMSIRLSHKFWLQLSTSLQSPAQLSPHLPCPAYVPRINCGPTQVFSLPGYLNELLFFPLLPS